MSDARHRPSASEPGPNPLAAGENNISVEAARAAIDAAIHPTTDVETVPIALAVGRILADDVISPLDVPPHDNSAMDGFAFDGRALDATQALTLRIVATMHAGAAPVEGVETGQCVRIMTGARMPAGLDTVVPFELCRVDDGDNVEIPASVIAAGENRRFRGEDLASGKAALTRGRVLRPADIGLIASLGLTTASVRRRLRVAVFSTGDEIVSPGQPLPPNCVYDSNRFALIAALQRLGMEPLDFGLVADNRASLQDAMARALEDVNVIITSGGVSAGDADYTRDVMTSMGSVSFWKVAMRPGRPFAFGKLSGRNGRDAWLFALPGNPVASLVGFYSLAREALLKLAGASAQPLPSLDARCTVDIRKRPGRTEFQRGFVWLGDDGKWMVRPVGSQGAGILRSMAEANALIVLPDNHGSTKAGDFVSVWLFDGLT
ncbi:molybdopterin molybdotransferase MoeA [Paraburkholderia sp. ZP32-5]|uniref:molybdopterin molybdotransferase MoeA n=1 Tax=Paraburkholderia sp. ZP32-5 TaxID=2883245 RepID=UPI001F253F1E|nr:gephyrin-like molybdotransferase Glp [Paraburkholderia sp. ZP32-5]